MPKPTPLKPVPSTRPTRVAKAATPAHAGRNFPLHVADVQGVARLGVEAVLGITDLVEAMHHTITSPASLLGRRPTGRTTGITGAVYRSVRGGTRLVGRGTDIALGALRWLSPEGTPSGPTSAADDEPAREALRAAANGAWGDHLADSGNPLAIAMNLRLQGRTLMLNQDGHLDALDLAALQGRGDKLLLLVHGLGMNPLQWNRNGHDHGQMLARELGYTPVYLHYNSGRHISQNGAEFARLLEALVARWPVALRELALVGHSMGGLVIRSACHHAAHHGMRWPARLTRLAFLGTPHHGAPLERGGRLVDMLFELSPYLAPFARLGKTRSAGVTDLRYGNLQDADWHGRDTHAQQHDDRHPTPLPTDVPTWLMAATVSKQLTGRRKSLLGDGLVPVASALGQHANPTLALKVPASRQHVLAAANHWDLLDRPEAGDTLRTWLA